MGVVHLARDTVLGRQLVLKFLSPAVAADEEARGRFAAEAKAASALDHPNICTVYDVGATETGNMYIAMAYYEGQTLKSRIAEGPFAIEEVADTALHTREEAEQVMQRARAVMAKEVRPVMASRVAAPRAGRGRVPPAAPPSADGSLLRLP